MRENLATIRSKLHQCALHRIVFRSFPPNSYNDLDIKEIWRAGSSLFMDTMKIPLLSLFKVSGTYGRQRIKQ
jgi:hypothetical protein